ncbi:MAG: PIG-L family deacetylase, partial [Gemmatimonadetes bacterium]|nr:PIG-L family deacetylase [Gemmatimonadota bacterium]
MTEPEQNRAPQTLLVALAHPDDEVGMVAAMRAQVERGDRVVLVWLTRGEMTEALGPIPTEEIIRRRTEHGRIAGEILGVETRFLDFPDTGVHATPEAAARVARVIAEVQPDAVLTWG